MTTIAATTNGAGTAQTTTTSVRCSLLCVCRIGCGGNGGGGNCCGGVPTFKQLIPSLEQSPRYIGPKGRDRTSLRGGEGEAIGGALQQRAMRKMHANLCMNPETATHVGIHLKPYSLQKISWESHVVQRKSVLQQQPHSISPNAFKHCLRSLMIFHLLIKFPASTPSPATLTTQGMKHVWYDALLGGS
jgi:hypothetical protein